MLAHIEKVVDTMVLIIVVVVAMVMVAMDVVTMVHIDLYGKISNIGDKMKIEKKLLSLVLIIGFVLSLNAYENTPIKTSTPIGTPLNHVVNNYNTTCSANTKKCNGCNTCIPLTQSCSTCSTYKPTVTPILRRNKTITINVVGQGVAPTNTISPAQAYAMAKRAAIGDGYRLIAEKVKGVYVEGQDLVRNMIVKRSSVRTSVSAMVRNANIVETTFKEGLCEVEMEITVCYSDFMYPGTLHQLY